MNMSEIQRVLSIASSRNSVDRFHGSTIFLSFENRQIYSDVYDKLLYPAYINNQIEFYKKRNENVIYINCKTLSKDFEFIKVNGAVLLFLNDIVQIRFEYKSEFGDYFPETGAPFELRIDQKII